AEPPGAREAANSRRGDWREIHGLLSVRRADWASSIQKPFSQSLSEGLRLQFDQRAPSVAQRLTMIGPGDGISRLPRRAGQSSTRHGGIARQGEVRERGPPIGAVDDARERVD